MRAIGQAAPFVGDLFDSPSLMVAVSKLDNGYVVNLTDTGALKKFQESPPEPPDPFEGLSPDARIDAMIDGIGALIQVINDKGAGEDWKEDGERGKLRQAFRIMFPGLAGTPIRYRQMPTSRVEHRVFESKEALLRFLSENL